MEREVILIAVKNKLQETFGEKIKDVILFGSQAWGGAHEDSDWDFVIVVRGEYDWRFERAVSDAMYDIDLKYEVITQDLIISEWELEHSLRGKQTIYQKAIKEGIYAV
jgi:predicted nucleotidyltransferase